MCHPFATLLHHSILHSSTLPRSSIHPNLSRLIDFLRQKFLKTNLHCDRRSSLFLSSHPKTNFLDKQCRLNTYISRIHASDSLEILLSIDPLRNIWGYLSLRSFLFWFIRHKSTPMLISTLNRWDDCFRIYHDIYLRFWRSIPLIRSFHPPKTILYTFFINCYY